MFCSRTWLMLRRIFFDFKFRVYWIIYISSEQSYPTRDAWHLLLKPAKEFVIRWLIKLLQCLNQSNDAQKTRNTNFRHSRDFSLYIRIKQVDQRFPNWAPRRSGESRDLARGAAETCKSCCIYCFPHKNYNVKVVSSFLQFYIVW